MESTQSMQAAVAGVPVEAAHEQGHGGGTPGLLSIDAPLLVLTWLAFAVMAAVLAKLAWKPMLAGLSARESFIRRALQEAEKARAETAQAEERQRQALAEGERRAQALVDEARAVAKELAQGLEAKARADAIATVGAAQREIATATERARAELRAASVDLAVELAARIVGERLDDDRQKALAERLAKDL